MERAKRVVASGEEGWLQDHFGREQVGYLFLKSAERGHLRMTMYLVNSLKADMRIGRDSAIGCAAVEGRDEVTRFLARQVFRTARWQGAETTDAVNIEMHVLVEAIERRCAEFGKGPDVVVRAVGIVEEEAARGSRY